MVPPRSSPGSASVIIAPIKYKSQLESNTLHPISHRTVRASSGGRARASGFPEEVPARGPTAAALITLADSSPVPSHLNRGHLSGECSGRQQHGGARGVTQAAGFPVRQTIRAVPGTAAGHQTAGAGRQGAVTCRAIPQPRSGEGEERGGVYHTICNDGLSVMAKRCENIDVNV